MQKHELTDLQGELELLEAETFEVQDYDGREEELSTMGGSTTSCTSCTSSCTSSSGTSCCG